VAKGKDFRSIINVASADLVVVLPGGPGTQAELELALSFSEKQVYVLLRQQDQVGPDRRVALPASSMSQARSSGSGHQSRLPKRLSNQSSSIAFS